MKVFAKLQRKINIGKTSIFLTNETIIKKNNRIASNNLVIITDR